MKAKASWQKLLSLLLCCMLLVGMLPTAVYATSTFSAAESLSWDNGKATWQNPNATGVVTNVRVELYNTEDETVPASYVDGIEEDRTSWDFSNTLIPGETYYFIVKFKDTEGTMLTSEKSAAFGWDGSFTPSAIEELTLNPNGVMSWYGQSFATKYLAQLFVKNGDNWVEASIQREIPPNGYYNLYTWDASNTSNGEDLEVGKTYKVQMTAMQGSMPVSPLTESGECTIPNTYIVTFKANGIGGDSNGNLLMLPVADGESLRKYLNITPNSWDILWPDAVLFDGAYYEVDGYCSTPECNDDWFSFSTNITADITLYARWIPAIEVDGTDVTKDNANDILGDGTASFDPATKTLTLKGYHGGAIEVVDGTTIVLADGTTNTISSTYICIYADGDLTITGNGSLTLDAYDDSIYADGDLTITSNGSLTLLSEVGDGIDTNGALSITGNGNLTIDAYGDGIWADGYVNIQRNGDISIKAADDDGIYTNGSITIGGTGKLTITSHEQCLDTEYNLDLYRNGDISMTSSDEECIDADEMVTIGGTGSLTIDAYDDGIWADDGIKISRNGEIFIESKNGDGMDSNDFITIEGTGNLTIDAYDDGICADNDIQLLRSGEIKISSSSDEGIDSSDGSITILNGNLTVNAADDGIHAEKGIEIGGDSNVFVNATSDAFYSYDGCLILSGYGKIVGNTNNGYAVYGNSSSGAVLLAGHNSDVRLFSAQNQAIYNEETGAPLISVDGLRHYTQTGNPDENRVTYTMQTIDITLPVEKTVKLGGDMEPEETTFTFELLSAFEEDENANPIFRVMDTAEIILSGKGTVDANLTFTVPSYLKDDNGSYSGVFLREKQDGGEGWQYDEVIYAVYDNGFEVFHNQSAGETVLEKASFVNTYTKKTPQNPNGNDQQPDNSNPNTGDNGSVVLWAALLFAVAGTTVVVSKKRSRS